MKDKATNFNKQFSTNIKKYRKISGISQEKMAEMLDIAPTTMSNLETGKTFVSASMLLKICDILKIEPYDLFIFGQLEASNVIYKKLLDNIKSDKIKKNAKALMLLYELTEQLKR